MRVNTVARCAVFISGSFKITEATISRIDVISAHLLHDYLLFFAILDRQFLKVTYVYDLERFCEAYVREIVISKAYVREIVISKAFL